MSDEKLTDGEIAATKHAYDVLGTTQLKDISVGTLEYLSLVVAMVPRLLTERAMMEENTKDLRKRLTEACRVSHCLAADVRNLECDYETQRRSLRKAKRGY